MKNTEQRPGSFLPRAKSSIVLASVVPLVLLLASITPAGAASRKAAVEIFPAEVSIGERLFTETRFAQYFAAHATDFNTDLVIGDPVVETTATTETRGKPLPGPFHGQSMNCRACHLVDEQTKYPVGGMRTYADFARHSPIPARSDGRVSTHRNSPPLVDATLPRPGGVILHFDGEFPSVRALIKGTLTGRNYGWLPTERSEAVAHIARIVREDNGTGFLARELGGPYRIVLGGTDPSIPDRLRLPKAFRLDVVRATDREILEAVARLIEAYVLSLQFERDENGNFDSSPYDRFLVENRLPLAPDRHESASDYAAHLLDAVDALADPVFIDEGPFEFHDQNRVFGPLELEGLRIFFSRPPSTLSGVRSTSAPVRPVRTASFPEPSHTRASMGAAKGGIGNCVACHTPPVFTDFTFHNTGVTQIEYDGVHGNGAFAALTVPSLAERRARPNDFLPVTASHPSALETFRSIAAVERPGFTDLGIWNIFANPDFPAPQAKLRRALCDSVRSSGQGGSAAATARSRCTTEALLDRSLAAFKTPSLRDLGHSDPYMHNGRFDTIESVIGFYMEVSEAGRNGDIRNEAPEISAIALSQEDIPALAAFLRALNEDYH